MNGGEEKKKGGKKTKKNYINTMFSKIKATTNPEQNRTASASK
jgi:hypothetical protein